MLNIAIVDDEEKYILYNHNALQKELDIRSLDYKITSFKSVELYMLQPIDQYDIVLLDIDLKDGNGIELAKQINEKNHKTQIIFITGYLNYATDISDANFTYFILKTEIETRIPKALDKVLARLYDNKLHIKCGKEKYILDQSNIVYFERNLRKTHIYTLDNKYTVYDSVDDLYEKVNHNLFGRCHNSYLVNVNYVSKYNNDDLTLNNGVKLSVSRGFRKEFQDFLFKQ